MYYELIGVGVTLCVVIIGASVAWGKMKKTLDSHTKSIEGCHMEDLVLEDDCFDRRKNCLIKLDKIMARQDENATKYREEMKSEIKSIKDDIREDNQLWGDYREKSAGALGRIEGQLSSLIIQKN